MTLTQCIDTLVRQHGGLRALARAAGLNPGYVSRLLDGEKTAPSDHTLTALGLERVVSYRVAAPARLVEMPKPACGLRRVR